MMISTKKESLRPRSKKRAKQEREYSKLRKEFLQTHFLCEVCWDQPSTSVHHKKGRIGELLTDPEFFLAICPFCHEKVENMPKWAKEHGYSISRLAKI